MMTECVLKDFKSQLDNLQHHRLLISYQQKVVDISAYQTMGSGNLISDGI
jgi:hypothetical protein